MKPWHALVVFLVLIGSSAGASFKSYRSTETLIRQELSRALVQTLNERGDHWITPDTIQTYRQHIQIENLREQSFLTYGNDNRIRFYTTCNAAQMFRMSDQRLPALLLSAGLLWSLFAATRLRRANSLQACGEVVRIGNLAYSADAHAFYDEHMEAVKLTPMQYQLMEMFFSAPGQELTKTDICEALWPKKDNASETLYTLIRRLKPVVEGRSNLKIEVERGRAYRLTERS